jgi:hypothetical protein
MRGTTQDEAQANVVFDLNQLTSRIHQRERRRDGEERARDPTAAEAGAAVAGERLTTPHIPGPRLGIDWSPKVSTLASTPLDSGT